MRGGRTERVSSSVIEEENGLSHVQSLYHELSPLVLLRCSGGLCGDVRKEKLKVGARNFGNFPVKDTGFWGISSLDGAPEGSLDEYRRRRTQRKPTSSRYVEKRRGGIVEVW